MLIYLNIHLVEGLNSRWVELHIHRPLLKLVPCYQHLNSICMTEDEKKHNQAHLNNSCNSQDIMAFAVLCILCKC